ncbi:MAG: replicative DNA helicase [Deltaproteobacteria bacterium]|nr:replicative DNA helicase [Deltaproteobacteria bacterium]
MAERPPSSGGAGRPLPHNRDAEASVLGGVLLNPKEALNQIIELLEPDDFYVPAHQAIYNAMLRLEQFGRPVDIITLEEQLRTSDELTRVGGVSGLAELATKVPTVENIAYHARIVRDKSTLRRLIQHTSEITAKAYTEPEPVDGFVDEAEHRIFELTQRTARSSYVPAKELLISAFAAIERRYEKKQSITGVPTGFHDLDEMTAGLQRSDLIIVAARPSMGKTALCLNIAQNSATLHNVPVLVFSLEMSKESLIERILCSEARVDSQKLRRGFLDQNDWMNLTRAASRIAEAPIWIDDAAAPSVLEIRAKSRRFRADRSIFSEPDQMGLIIVDYLQLVRGPRQVDSREREVAEVSRGLKALAKEVALPVIALSQLRRAAEDRKGSPPQLSDLRESGAIEQDADVIAFIHRSEEMRDQGLAELIIGKQRNGPVGGVPLVFLDKYTRFESRARHGE